MKFLRVGICALVVFGVAAHGGVEDWARAVMEIGAGLLFWPGLFGSFSTAKNSLFFRPSCRRSRRYRSSF